MDALWALLEAQLHDPGLAAAAAEVGFRHKHNASEIIAEIQGPLRNQPIKVQHRFVKNQASYDEYIRVRRAVFAQVGALDKATMPDEVLRLMCDLLRLDFAVLPYAPPAPCARNTTAP